MTADRPVRVAIIGGGCAAMAAAFELSRPELNQRFDLTVYQVGWRLGGKGASGRGAAGRIEEHGLHLWMGYYENAFQLLRECYAELDRQDPDCPIRDWQDAFQRANAVGVMDRDAAGRWSPWLVEFRPNAGLPGDRDPGAPLYTLEGYLAESAQLIAMLVRAALETPDAPHGASPAPSPARWASTMMNTTLTLTLAAIDGALAALGELTGAAAGGRNARAIVEQLNQLTSAFHAWLEASVATDQFQRRVWETVDVLAATMRGVIQFGLLTDPRGLDAISNWDYREWLRHCGASPLSIDSAVVRGMYDLTFAYERGDAERPRLNAAQAVRGALRSFFTRRGAFFWKMRAGMGDVVFAPYFEVLRARGVRFEFFHRLTDVGIREDDHGPFVDRLAFEVQAETVGGAPYEPLHLVNGLPCWPSEPDWSQLQDGERYREYCVDFESHWDRRGVRRTRTLRVTEDFDFVVLAVGLGEIPHVCKEILARDARWRDMVDRLQTIPTQAFQVWLTETPEGLGWEGPPADITGYVHPFDTWADMRQLLPVEDWPADHQPRGLAYFCAVLPELDLGPPPDVPGPQQLAPAPPSAAAYASRAQAQVKRDAEAFLREHVAAYWPASHTGTDFDWSLLVAPAQGSPPASGIESQYWRANVNPSDRYVLAAPGTDRFRISPLDRTYDNLTVAGDWTDCGFNAGCVEAAVIAGRLAAHALAKAPALEDIVGYDHP